MTRSIGMSTLLAAALIAAGLVACGKGKPSTGSTTTVAAASTSSAAPAALSGSISVDGSSTVYPVTQAANEAFSRANEDVRISVAFSGTGGGFRKFCDGETDISNASRPIKDEEATTCASSGVEYIEIPIAFDGLTVVVNKSNDFVDKLTVAELKAIWEPASQGTVTRWNQVRATFPDRELKLFGPGPDSGTFDYFTEVIVGESGSSRTDYSASENDNTLVTGIASNPDSLGYFGYAYYVPSADKLQAVPIAADDATAGIEPSSTSIMDGSYTPLSRPLFIYVRKESLARPEVEAFVNFYLTQAERLVTATGYVPLPAGDYQRSLARLKAKDFGPKYRATWRKGMTLTQVYGS